MTETQFEQVCNMFFEMSQLPLTVCQAGGEPVYWVPFTDSPDEPPQANRALIERFTQIATDQAIPFVEIFDPTFFFAVVKLDKGRYLVIGPVAPVKHDDANVLRLSAARGVPEEKRISYFERIKQSPIVSFRHFLTTVALVNYLVNRVVVPPDSILLLRPSKSLEMEEKLTEAMFHARENQVVHTPSSYEHYVLQAVTDGNVAKLKQALMSPQSGAIGRMSGDPIQQEKYTFISFVTLVTRAAIAGGLSQELAFSLSDIYCQTVDRLQNILEITKLEMEMVLDFTEKVAAAKGRTRLSPDISMCCEYISTHLHTEIDLPQIAALVHKGSKSLSKKFANETGLSITDYVHRERIKEAQSLLEYSDYSISEIGYYLQYSSQSYFSSVFKKFNGVTPQQFRDQLKKAKQF